MHTERKEFVGKMVGQVIYTGTDGYQEIVEATNGAGVRLIECTSLASQFPMYRLEYTDCGYRQHETYQDWTSANANYERRSQENA